MKRLFKHIAVFVIPFLLLVIVAMIASRSYFQNDDFYRLNPATTTVVLGHSQTECGFNDRLVRGTQNFSQGGEAYFYTYQKLKKFIDANPSLKNVVVSFSNNQIDSQMDKWVWGEENMYSYYPKYAFMMEMQDYEMLMQNNPKTMLAAEAKMFKSFASSAIKGRDNLLEDRNWGGYLHLKRKKIDSLIKTDYLRKESKRDLKQVSQISIDYLQKIKQLCDQHQVKLFFIRMPAHQLWVYRQNEDLFQQVRKKYFNEVRFLDFQDFPLTNDEMGDFDHLNFDGAKRFSLFFGDLMHRGLLQSADPQKRIDDAQLQIKVNDSILKR